MAVHRKARAYSKRKPVVNTRRSKLAKFNYNKAVPSQKIVKFNMGDVKGMDEGKYKIKMAIMTEEDIQIRDLALEATRQCLMKDFTDGFQKSFFLRCHCYPHNILRNNRVFSGGSKGERVQTGMSKSFGTAEGRAATIRKNYPVFSAYFNGEENIHKVKGYFAKACPKLPCKVRFVVERLK